MRRDDLLQFKNKRICFYHTSVTNDKNRPTFSVGKVLDVTESSLILDFHGQKQVYDLTTILTARESESDPTSD